jgi:NADPH:quinone reductase-like Zn-dependent oxidoreductase
MRQDRLAAGQTVLIHGAAGGVGSIAVQLAREAGARVIGTGQSADRDRALGWAHQTCERPAAHANRRGAAFLQMTPVVANMSTTHAS